MKGPTRRQVLRAGGGLLLGTAAGTGIAAGFRGAWRPRRPPRLVLVICVDCLRADQLAPYGSGENVAPFLNQFAESSVVFERAYTNGNWTKPAVASFFTGLRPGEHGVIKTVKPGVDPAEEGVALGRGAATLAAVFDRAGYFTAAFLCQPHLVKELGFNRGFDVYQQGWFDAVKIERLWRGCFNSLKRSTKAFVYLHFLDCHSPYLPPEKYKGLFGPVDQALPGGEDWSKSGVWAALRDGVNAGERSISEEAAAHFMNMYKGEVRHVDDCIGQIIGRIAAQDRLDEALIVVFSDHGDNFLEHGVLGHAPPHFYEEQLRIPLLIKFPRSWDIPNARVGREVQTVDISATLAKAVGRGEFGVGRDLLQPAGRDGETRRYVITQSDKGMTVISGGLKAYVAWDGDSPLIENVFDVAVDSAETHDIRDRAGEYVRSLQTFLPRWQRSAQQTLAVVGRGTGAERVSRENIEALKALGYLN